MKIDYAGKTYQGKRARNEDALLMCAEEQGAIFLVADGIGGRQHGEVASGLIRDGYHRWWMETFLSSRRPLPFHEAIESLRGELIYLNRMIVQEYGERTAGSTLVLLFLYEGKCVCISAGDSRLYRLRGLSFRQLTRDDIFDNLPDRSGGSADAGKLVGAVGIRIAPQYSVWTDQLRPGDCFLLCTDGVYRYMRAGKLRGMATLGGWMATPERLVDSVAADVKRNGAGDNYTLIFIKVKE